MARGIAGEETTRRCFEAAHHLPRSAPLFPHSNEARCTHHNQETPGVEEHVCIFGTDIDFFENRTIPSILTSVELLEI